jgi:LacI family transcriptional regulator
MHRKPTLYDVAARAGVSHMTVSRVIRRVGGVSDRLSDKVRAAVAELGYRPDPSLSALAHYRSSLSRRKPGGHSAAYLHVESGYFSTQACNGARNEGEFLGYDLAEHVLPTGRRARADLLKRLHHEGVVALLIGPSPSALDLGCMEFSAFAPVSLDAQPHSPAFHAVAMDYFHGLGLAWDGLRYMGCGRIGLMLPRNLESRTAHQWLGSYLVRESSIPPMLSANPPFKSRFREWIRFHRIDGMLTLPYSEDSVRFPRGVRVAFLNSVGIPAGFPHVALDPREIGSHAMRLAAEMVRHGEFGLPKRAHLIALRGTWSANCDMDARNRTV